MVETAARAGRRCGERRRRGRRAIIPRLPRSGGPAVEAAGACPFLRPARRPRGVPTPGALDRRRASGAGRRGNGGLIAVQSTRRGSTTPAELAPTLTAAERLSFI